MAEKVLFEYRAEREGNGYKYEIRRGSEYVEIKSSMPLGRHAWKERARMKARRRARWFFQRAGMPRRKARRALDALEEMYQDIYGQGPESPEAEPGTVI